MAKNQRTDPIRTPEARAAFANLFTAREAMQAGKPAQYGVTLLINKVDQAAGIASMKAAAKTLGEQVFGPTFVEQVKAKKLKWPFRDGDQEKPDLEAFPGCIFINATSKNKPLLVDGRRNPITDPEELGSGDYVHASVNFFAFDTSGNKGIACGLRAVQRVRKGAPLGGGRASAEKEFDDMGEGSDADAEAPATSEFDI